MGARNDQHVFIHKKDPSRKILSYRVALLNCCLFTALLARHVNGQSTNTSPAQSAPAANLAEEVRLLRAEVSELRAELDGLRQIVKGHQTETNQIADSTTGAAISGASTRTIQPNQSGAPSAVPQEAATPSTPGIIQSQVAELAQTKAESNSKMPLKIYGTILSTTFFNSRGVDWADQPVRVLLPSEVASNTGSFSSSLRQSRIGVLIDGPTIGRFKSSGVFAFDFNGGMTDFRSSPLFGLANIVYGYVRLESSRTAIEAGQDELIFAPRNPTSLVALSYPELYRAGNLYVRAPQIRLERKLIDDKQGQLKLTAGLVAPVGTYPPFDNPNAAAAPPAGWQRPAIQGRLSWQSASLASGDDSGLELGASGHYGRVGLGQFSAASWAGGFDFNLKLQRWGVDGEGFFGQNLQAFGGGIGQPGKTMGGYLEGRFLPTNRLQFNAGFGTDHLTKLDIISVPIKRNSAVFANTIYQFTPEFSASFEYRFMFTSPFQGVVKRNNNLNLGIAYSF
jgi:hypothetical protein